MTRREAVPRPESYVLAGRTTRTATDRLHGADFEARPRRCRVRCSAAATGDGSSLGPLRSVGQAPIELAGDAF